GRPATADAGPAATTGTAATNTAATTTAATMTIAAPVPAQSPARPTPSPEEPVSPEDQPHPASPAGAPSGVPQEDSPRRRDTGAGAEIDAATDDAATEIDAATDTGAGIDTGTGAGVETGTGAGPFGEPPEVAEDLDADPPDEPAPQPVSADDVARVARLATEVLVVDGRPRYHLAG